MPLFNLYGVAGNVILVGNPTTINSSVSSPMTMNDNTAASVVLSIFSLDKGTNAGAWTITSPTALVSKLQITKGAGLTAQLSTLSGISNALIGAHVITVHYIGESVNLTYAMTINVVAHGTSTWAGPRSGLGWHSGGYGALTDLRDLRVKGGVLRDFDCLRVFSNPGTYSQNQWADWSARFNVGGTSGTWHMVKTNRVRCLVIAVRIFCGGTPTLSQIQSSFPAKGSLPFGAFIGSNFPVGWASSVTNASNRLNLVRDTWLHASDDASSGGHFDHLWRDPLTGLKNQLVADAITDTKIVLCPAWEGDKGWVWGDLSGAGTSGIDSSYAWIANQGDLDLVKGVFRQFASVARSVFSGYAGGVYLNFNPLRGGDIGGGFDKTDLIELNTWDILGPDYYDTGDNVNGHAWSTDPAKQDDKRWSVIQARTIDALSGLTSYAAFIRNNLATHPNLKLGIGEWACWSKYKNAAGDIWPDNLGGDDNPTWINNMFDFFTANADIMAYESYFNKNDPYLHWLTLSGGGTRFPNASAMYASKFANMAGVGDPH